MATRQELLIEANSRGLLTGQQKAAFDEAVSRGIISLPSVQPAQIGAPLATQAQIPPQPGQEQVRRELLGIPQPQPIAPTQPIQQAAPLAAERFGAGAVRPVEAAPPPTRAVQELPELGGGGLLAGEDAAKNIAITPALLTTTDPSEIASILTSNFPNIGIQSDEAGNLIATNNRTGTRVVINKPGLSQLDIIQGLGLAAAFTPAGRAAAIPIAAARSGATEAVIQAVQAGSGGRFDISEVLSSTALGALGQKASDLIESAKTQVAQLLRTSDPSIDEQTIAQATEQLIPTRIPEAEIPPTAIAQPIQPSQATQQTAEREAAKITGPSSEEQRKNLAETILKGKTTEIAAEVIPDERIQQAAQELGVDLIPSNVSQNLVFRELEQGLKSVPGSQLKAKEAEAVTALAQKADDLITEFGGTLDKTELGLRFEQEAGKTIFDMGKQANTLYNKVRESIPAKTPAEPEGLLNFIRDRADDFGGEQELTQLEQLLLKRLSADTNPTYARLDELRKRVGAAKRGQGDQIFQSADRGLLTKLESLMLDAQQDIAQQRGAGDLFKSARTSVAQRKTLEENLKFIFGRNLQKDFQPQVGRALQQLSKGQIKNFENLMERIPKELRQETLLTSLNDVFTLGSRKEKQLSLPGFVDWYEGLKRNKQAFNLVQRNLPAGAAKRLDLIATVAGGIRRAQESEIKTGRIVAVPELFNTLESKMGKIFGIASKAAAAEVPGSLVGLPGVGSATVITAALTKSKTPRSESADKLLASPLFKGALEAITTQGKQAAQDQAVKLERSKVFKDWLKTLPATEARAINTAGFADWITEEEER